MTAITPVLTMDDFIKQWDKRLDRIIRSYKLWEYCEDIKQEIYLRIFENNGLAKYDPTIGSFSTYVYAVVLTKIRNFRKRYSRERAAMPVSLDEAAVDQDGAVSDTPERGKLSAEQVHGMRLVSDSEKEFELQVQAIRRILAACPVRSTFFRDSEVVTRDLLTLFDMIVEGKSRAEMTEHFEYSTGSVGIMFEDLRKIPEVQELRLFMTS